MMQLLRSLTIAYVASIVIAIVFLQIPINAFLEQPQLISKDTASAILQSQFTLFIGKARILTPNTLCSFINLTECHDNGQNHKLYYETCFTSHMCPEENYYCINGVGYTIHICGEFSDCRKRYRNIVLRDASDSDNVKVYSIPCPDGYFQFGNCFHACMEDDSIIISRNSTNTSPAEGYCNYNRNYCNAERVTVFVLGSQNDNCVKYSYVENVIKCDGNEDLMPNCSCVHSCLRGQIRNRNFICQWPNSSVTAQSSSTGIIVSDSVTKSSSHETSQTTISDDGQPNDTLNYVVVVVTVSLVVTIAVLVGVVVRMAIKRGSEYQKVLLSSNRNEGDIEEGPVQHANGDTPGVVRNETRTKTTEKYNANGDINIQNGDILIQVINGQTAPTTTPDLESGQSSRDAMSNESTDEPQMENLKSFVNEEGDSGIASSDTTYVKRP